MHDYWWPESPAEVQARLIQKAKQDGCGSDADLARKIKIDVRCERADFRGDAGLSCCKRPHGRRRSASGAAAHSRRSEALVRSMYRSPSPSARPAPGARKLKRSPMRAMWGSPDRGSAAADGR